MLALLNRRGVGETFLAQMAQRLQDPRVDGRAGGARLAAPGRAAPRRDPDPAAGGAGRRQPERRQRDHLAALDRRRRLARHRRPDQRADAADAAARRRSPPSATTPATGPCTRSRSWRKKSGKSERAVAETLLELMHARRGPTPTATTTTPRSVAAYWLLGPGPGHAAAGDRPAATRMPGSAGPGCAGSPCRPTSARSRSRPAAIVAWLLLRHSAALAPGIAPWLGALAAFADARSRLRGGGRGHQPADQRIGATEPSAAAGVRDRHPARAPADGRHSGDADRPGIGPGARPSAAAALPRQSRARRAVRAAHRLGRRADRAAAADDARPARRGGAGDRAPERALSGRPTSRRASSSCTASGRFAESEQRWIGWERKRGKLEQLLGMLAEGSARALPRPRPGLDASPPGVRYVLTLDSDTRLPPGRLRDLVGVAAHPHNRPRLVGRRPARRARLRHPAAARRHAAVRARGRHALPLAVLRPERHRPLQRRQLRGLPGRVRRRHLHRQGPARRAGGARRARRPPARRARC